MLAAKAIVLLLLGLSLSFAHQCSYISTKGSTYDFSLMRNLGDLTIQSERIGTYYYQVCSEVVSRCGNGKEAAVCIKNGNETTNAGTPDAVWQDSKTKEDEGVTIIYSHGDVCGADGSRRKTVVQLQCYLQATVAFKSNKIDTSSIQSYISSVSDDGCTARMIVMTPFACPTNKNYSSSCSSRTARDECLIAGSNGFCDCNWCDNRCVASFEQCDGIRETTCYQSDQALVVMVFPLLTTLIMFCLLTCLCCCICAARRRNLKKKLDSKLRLPVKNNGYDEVAMEPLMMQPPMMEPQYVYVQYPMPSGQQHPPLYAPNPVFVVPQYTQQMQ